jgi:molecular chaperone DnaK
MEQALSDSKISPRDIGKVILVGGPTRMPILKKFVEDFFGREAERGVDPMECVAVGASIQGGVLAGEVRDILLLDVTPLSLGVETLGGVMTRLIERNTTIPTRKSQIFTTAADFQTTVTIHVLQGERTMAADNISLGSFNLEGIPPAPRGVPQIEVTFDIDANGLLNVSAKDMATGKEQKITITASTKLASADKERMVNEAAKYAEEDRTRREEVEIRNNAESMIYTAEKTRADFKDKITKDLDDRIVKGLSDVKEALKGADTVKIKSLTEELGKVLQEIGAQMYKSTAQQDVGPERPPEGEAAGKEKVVDSEYKVVDEEEKKQSG